MLRAKPDGGQRMVTDFTGLNQYIRKTPASNPTIAEAQKRIASYKVMVEADLSGFYYQGGMLQSDMQWLGSLLLLLGECIEKWTRRGKNFKHGTPTHHLIIRDYYPPCSSYRIDPPPLF